MESRKFFQIYDNMNSERLSGVIECGYYLKGLYESPIHFHEMVEHLSKDGQIELLEITLTGTVKLFEKQVEEMKQGLASKQITGDYFIGYTTQLETYIDLLKEETFESQKQFINFVIISHYFAVRTYENREGVIQ